MTKSRAQESRENNPIRNFTSTNFQPGMSLNFERFPPREGYVQRWVRVKTAAGDDMGNISQKLNAGWNPRAASSIPKDVYATTMNLHGTEVILVSNMVLMERPAEVHEAHGKWVEEQTKNQMLSVADTLSNSHVPGSGMTRPEMSSSTKVSQGRDVEIDPD